MESTHHPSIKLDLQNLPTGPGVYLMKDPQGEVLYIGKAKNLRARVRSYFGPSGDTRYALRFLVPKIHSVETILTDTEKEAILLENTLIKKYKPRHNIRLADDKTYFSLRYDLREDYPKLTLVRKVQKDGARYFGPFASSAAVKETLRVLQRVFPLRSCPDSQFHHRSRPCLNHQIQKCLAPCCGFISKEQYADLARDVLLFLEGKNSELLRMLRERMNAASAALNFEEAARIRDQLQAIEQTLEKQKAAFYGETADQDVIAFYRQGNDWEFQVLFFRHGLLIGNKSYPFKGLDLPEEEALSAFLRQFYASDRIIPHEVLLPTALEDQPLLSEWLSEKKGAPVQVLAPQKGEKRRLVEMAGKNAEHAFKTRVSESEALDQTLRELQEKLHLPRPPHRIECFDISNLFGTLAVGSMVSFQDGKPDPGRYRHYKVLGPSFPDDYAMLYEVLKRRYQKVAEEPPAPDLLMVDGGKGQLHVALTVLRELGLKNLSAIGLAKDRETGSGKDRKSSPGSDKIYLPGRKDPLLLPSHSLALRYLQRIRDEAHRFAVTYHKKLRGKKGLKTMLGEIPGIGEVKRKALLSHFGHVEGIAKASMEELLQVKPLTSQDARRVFDFFHSPESPP
jgi:excinuclease ABC subunit C